MLSQQVHDRQRGELRFIWSNGTVLICNGTQDLLKEEGLENQGVTWPEALKGSCLDQVRITFAMAFYTFLFIQGVINLVGV